MSDTIAHKILSISATEASEPGALSGHVAVCSCGERISTSLSIHEARRLAWGHVDYFARLAEKKVKKTAKRSR